MMKNKILIIKCFIVVFIALLFFPNDGLFRGEKNVAMIAKENRKITSFPKQSIKDKNFYSNFEKWYQDRLRYRDKAILHWRRLNFVFGVILKENIFIGKDGWLFNRHNVINNFRDKEEKIKNIKELQNYCERRGKQFILMVPPTKEAVYVSYFPADEKARHRDYFDWENELKDATSKLQINYLSVTKALFDQRDVSKGALYFNDDHHWSYYGSFIASDILLNEMGRKNIGLTDYKLVLDGSEKEAFKEWSYLGQLGFGKNTKTLAPWNNNYTDEIYVTDTHSKKTIKVNGVLSNNVLWGKIVRGEAIVENKSIDKNLTVLVLGDSYSSYMMPYLSQKVSKIVSTHYRDCAEKKKAVEIKRLLDTYEPDVVVLEMVANSFYHTKGKRNYEKMIF